MNEQEKKLDLEGIAEDAAEAERIAGEYEKEREALVGQFEYRLKKPVNWKGHMIESLHFDYDRITGGVINKAENAYFRDTGRQVIQTAFNDGFQTFVAALVCTDRDGKGNPFVTVETIEALSAVDFRMLIQKFNRFFVSIETEAMQSGKTA